MARYAYIPYHPLYVQALDHVEVDEFQGKKVLKVDSTELTEQDYDVIRNQLKETCYCYSCDAQMKFYYQPKNRNSHFTHLTRNNCFQAEGLAHASVKKDLFQRFQERGYQVLMEREFQANKNKVRTDVAVMDQEDILAIEVQASPSIKRSTVTERTNTYSSANIPTAWVIVLNSFFGDGKYTSLSENVLVKNEDGTKTSKKQMIPFDKPTPFFILADIPNSFHLLMNAYKYVVSVNHDGHYFLIREKDVAVKGEYEVYRIEQDRVVDVLLATEVLNIDYVPEKKAAEQPDSELEHNEGKHQSEQWAGERILNIDFQKAYQEEQDQLKHEEAIDILMVVEETKRREQFSFQKQQVMESLNTELIELQDKQEQNQSVWERLQADFKRQEKLLKEKNRLEKHEKTEILSSIRAYKEMNPYFDELIASWEAQADLEEMPVNRLKKAVEILEQKKFKFAVKVVREAYAEVSEIISNIPDMHPTAVAQQFVKVMRNKEHPPKNPNDLYVQINGELINRKNYKDLLQQLMFHKEKMMIVAEYYFWWENISLQDKNKIKSERYRQARS